MVAFGDFEHPFLRTDEGADIEQSDKLIHDNIMRRMGERGRTQGKLAGMMRGDRAAHPTRSRLSHMLAHPSRLTAGQARDLVLALDCTGDHLRGVAGHPDATRQQAALPTDEIVRMYEGLDRDRRHVASEVITALHREWVREHNDSMLRLEDHLMELSKPTGGEMP